MNITITPSLLLGDISIIPSKSLLHRYLICSAFADTTTELIGATTARDIEATIGCLRALGANIIATEIGFIVEPIQTLPARATLHCFDSGTTFRFMLPIIGALGIDAKFTLSGRLPQRPIAPLLEEMERMGCCLSWLDSNTLHCCGRLTSGTFSITGNISSQFISGLLFGCALMDGHSKISVLGKLESQPYVDLTLQVLSAFGLSACELSLEGCVFRSPGRVFIEGDWSSAACFLSANAMGSKIHVTGLSDASSQGDREIINIIHKIENNISIDASNIPDLVPILAVVACNKCGATFHNVDRLRLKESDRIESLCTLLRSLGCSVTTTKNTLTVCPGRFKSCTVDACKDHRIAMAAAVAATVADGPVTVIGAECVEKSYPSFWQEYQRLGGKYEQQLW